MLSDAIWIRGVSQSGKTTRLVERYCQWGQSRFLGDAWPRPAGPLVLGVNREKSNELADLIAIRTQGQYPPQIITPLNFLREEVILFWPLLIQALDIPAQFPLRLRPETEEELATQLWRRQFPDQTFAQSGMNLDRMVRQTLDLFQSAALSGTPIENIPEILQQGLDNWNTGTPMYENAGEFLLKWKEWCWQNGFLTYGIIAELYSRYLFQNPHYQQHLKQRYSAIFADDVDEYPAIFRPLLEFFLDYQGVGVFTYNPDGGIRLGLDADPEYLAELEQRCQVEFLPAPFPPCLAPDLADTVINLVLDPDVAAWSDIMLPGTIHAIQTLSRGELLRRTADIIIQSVKSDQVQPEDIAIIAPGLDPIARYSLMELLESQGIPVESLNEQRPLSSSPMVRALLTLLTLIYPGNGRLADRDAVAEMLVILSQTTVTSPNQALEPATPATPQPITALIDPVRAGLIVDHCFVPDANHPHLLPVTAFPRWDRLGYRATQTYQQILDWLKQHQSPSNQQTPLIILDQAIQHFLCNSGHLGREQLTVLRELITIAQHYWQVQDRLHSIHPLSPTPYSETVGRFVQLLRRGTITANPFSVEPLGGSKGAITLGTIFQYRFSRRCHPWHFWLDAGSPLWLRSGDAVRFGATLFLKNWSGQALTLEDTIEADKQRLQRILLDLLSRVGQRLYLCHSELAVNGQEQLGPLLPLIHRSRVETVTVN